MMTPFAHKYQKIFYILSLAAILLSAAVCLVCYFLGVSPTDFIRPCIFNQLTGYYCPGCGGTRAVISLLHLNIIQSFIYHPFVPYVAIIAAIFIVSYTVSLISKGKIGYFKLRPIYFYVSIALILINFVVKNVLIYNGIWIA